MTEQKAQELQRTKEKAQDLRDAKEKAREVFELIETKTANSQLEWRTDENEDIYTATTTNGFILKIYPFTSYVNEEPVGPASLTLYDGTQKLIFDITTDVVKAERLSKLYQLAKDRAERTEEKLQMIIEDLSALD